MVSICSRYNSNTIDLEFSSMVIKRYLVTAFLCRFPMVIDPTEIAARFLQYRECTFINGLDHEFMNSPDRIRIAVLGALRQVQGLHYFDIDEYHDYQS